MSGMPPDVFQMARDTYTVPELWIMLRLPGDPRPHGNQRSPFRDERHPSFSIFDNGTAWKDQGTGHGGDVVEFVKHALGGEYSDVREWFAERLGLDVLDGLQSARTSRPAPKAPEPPVPLQPIEDWPGKLVNGTAETWQAFAARRGMSYRSAWVAVHAGLLRFLRLPDGTPCYCVTDDSRRCAEIRRMDGQFFGDKKAFPLKMPPGAKSWFPGLEIAEGTPRQVSIFVAEGASDTLAAVHLYTEYRKTGGANPWIPCGMLGASNRKLSLEAERIMRGRRVRLCPDGDPAGDEMAAHWKPLLLSIGCTVDVLKMPRGKDLSDVAGQIKPQQIFG